MYANSNKFIDPPAWRVEDKEGAQMALPPLAAGLHAVVITPQQREGGRTLYYLPALHVSKLMNEHALRDKEHQATFF